MDRTLVIIKPDAVERGLAGEIVARLERKGLRLEAAQVRTIDASTAALHYAEHVGRPYYEPLVEFITRGPSLILVVSGVPEVWGVVRSLMGVTNPLEAAPGTIRGDFGLITRENLVHGSDSAASAQREIGIFFPELA